MNLIMDISDLKASRLLKPFEVNGIEADNVSIERWGNRVVLKCVERR